MLYNKIKGGIKAMSNNTLYTTGELAKLCSITVRTVQYYDTRGILSPSELSEGGRRLYSEDDLQRMKIICFLRELGMSINSISQLLSESDPESILALLIEQQEQELRCEISAQQTKLDRLIELKRELRAVDKFSVESIGDIAYQMENKKKLQKMRLTMLLSGLPISILEIGSIILWAITGIWWPFVVWLVIMIPYGIIISRYYYNSVDYICPQCHTVFKPTFKEMFFAAHTPKTRKLSCKKCGHHGFCVEVWGNDEK